MQEYVPKDVHHSQRDASRALHCHVLMAHNPSEPNDQDGLQPPTTKPGPRHNVEGPVRDGELERDETELTVVERRGAEDRLIGIDLRREIQAID